MERGTVLPISAAVIEVRKDLAVSRLPVLL